MQTHSSVNKKEQLFPRISTPDFKPPHSRLGRRPSEEISPNFTLTPSFAYKKITPREESSSITYIPAKSQQNITTSSLYSKDNNSSELSTGGIPHSHSSTNLYSSSLTPSTSSSGGLSPVLSHKRVSTPTLHIPTNIHVGASSAPPSSHANSQQHPMIITSFFLPTTPTSSTHASLSSTGTSVLSTSPSSSLNFESISIVVPEPSSTSSSMSFSSISLSNPTTRPTTPNPPTSMGSSLYCPTVPQLSLSTPTTPFEKKRGEKRSQGVTASTSTGASTSAASTSITLNSNSGNAGSIQAGGSGNAGATTTSTTTSTTTATITSTDTPAKPASVPTPPVAPASVFTKNVPPPMGVAIGRPSTSASPEHPIQKAIAAFKEIQETVNDSYKLPQSHLLVIGSDKNSVVHALQELDYTVTMIPTVKEAVRHLRDDTELIGLRTYDVIVILCDFQSLRDSLPVSALVSIKAVARSLPIIMAINSFHENQIVRLMKEGAQDVIYPPYSRNILQARLHSLLESSSLKRKFSQLAHDNMAGLSGYLEKLQDVERKTKMREFQVQILEEVRTNAESHIKKLEDKVSELTNAVENTAQNSSRIKVANVALKWKMIAKQQTSTNLIQTAAAQTGAYAPATPLQKLMEIARKLNRDISKEEVDFLLYDLSHSGFADKLESLDLVSLNTELSLEINDVSKIDFCPLDITVDRIIMTVIKMFNHLNLLTHFNINEQKFKRFLYLLSNHYNPNPYHNFHHACDVLQMVFFTLVTTEMRSYISKTETLSLMLAALCHDVEHPGVNNTFQVNSKTQLALLYNDVSVLENHHSAHTFHLLRESEHNILENLTDTQFKEVRFSMVQSILNTDMARHFELITKFAAVTQKPAFLQQQHAPPSPHNPPPPSPRGTTTPNNTSEHNNSTQHLSPPPVHHPMLKKSHSATSLPLQLEKPDRQILLDTILHTADISNMVRPWHVSRLWADRLFIEFLSQGDSERDLGIPVSPYMDRRDTDQVKMSLNFIDFLCMPLYSAVAKAFPTLDVCVENLKKNREMWESMRNATSSSTTASSSTASTSTKA